jgi:predicted PurR-regulated permease PerM
MSENQTDSSSKGVSLQTQKRAFLAILALSIFLVGYTLSGYATTIVLGSILAGAFYPLLNWLLEKTKWKRKIWSSILSVLIFLIIMLPVVFITIELTREVFKTYQYIQSGQTTGVFRDILFGDHFVADTMRWVANKIGFEYTPVVIEKWITSSLKNVLLKAFNSLNALVSNLFSFLFSLILMQIYIYALFLEGPRIRKFFIRLFPMDDAEEETIFKTINTMNFTTLLSNGIGGLIQGILAATGFWIAGIPSVILWGIIMVMLAFIPLVGISIITVPASFYLFLKGEQVTAVILLTYCTVVALATENWFKPIFMGKRVQINPFLMFFGIIGGMSAFGFIGIFYGPIIIAVFLTVTDLYFKRLDKVTNRVNSDP